MSKLIGKRFGRLVVVNSFYKHNGKQNNLYYVCDCDCGNEKSVRGDALTSKKPTRSCGCITKELAVEKATRMGIRNKKHGMSRTRIYKTWDAMKSRCENTNDKDYPNYGGRGITYQDSWSDFEFFYADMKSGYRDDLTLDRIDVNGNYNKENCRWASVQVQNNNKRTSLALKYKGVEKHITEWARELGIHPGTLTSRLRCGWSIERVLSEPVNNKVFSGSYYDKESGKWRAYVKRDNKRVHIGYFETEIAAKIAIEQLNNSVRHSS